MLANLTLETYSRTFMQRVLSHLLADDVDSTINDPAARIVSQKSSHPKTFRNIHWGYVTCF